MGTNVLTEQLQKKSINTPVKVAVASGDGIGPEIMMSTLRILEAAGANIEPEFIDLGEKVYLSGNTSGITSEAWEAIRQNKIIFKAPITTPQGKGYKSLNVTLRKSLGLFANVRPVVALYPYVPTNFPKMDVDKDAAGNPLADCKANELPNGIDFANYGGFYFFNFYGKNLFGYGGGLPQSNHFQVIEQKREIQFYEIDKVKVYMEYISDGINPDEKTYVHPYLADYLRKYALHEYEQRRPGRTQMSIYGTGRTLYFAEMAIRARKNDLDPKSALNLHRKYYRLSVKV